MTRSMPFRHLRAPRNPHIIAENEARFQVAMALRNIRNNRAAWRRLEDLLAAGRPWTEIRATFVPPP